MKLTTLVVIATDYIGSCKSKYGLQLPVISVPITTNVASLYPAHGTWYNIM
jgi:hypothetical protein